MLTRRFFLEGALGLSAFSCSKALGGDALADSGELLRFGVLSDIHLHRPGDEDTFLKALTYFRDRKVDAVLLAGDIADTGLIAQLKRCADTWFKVFPDDRAPDGRKVERLFVYGNHCVSIGKGPDSLNYGDNRMTAWRELFHEDWTPIWRKTVKGIPVIGAHWSTDAAGIPIEAYMKAHAKELDPSLPFVYTQHQHPKDTCFGAWAWGHDDGRATRALSPFPNAIAFSGHSHYTLTDERTVWQGGFTSINTSSLRYSSTDYALRENIRGNSHGFRGEERAHRMPCVDTNDGRQGMVVSLRRDHFVIERREFVYGQSLGDNWVVPLPTAESRPFAYAARAKKRSAPAFAAGASVSVAETPAKDAKDFRHVVLTFPAAKEVNGCRVNEYEVTAVLVEDDVELVALQRRMASPDYHLPRTKLVGEVKFTFAAEDFPYRKGHYRFEVRPLECFGKKGEKIVSPVTLVG